MSGWLGYVIAGTTAVTGVAAFGWKVHLDREAERKDAEARRRQAEDQQRLVALKVTGMRAAGQPFTLIPPKVNVAVLNRNPYAVRAVAAFILYREAAQSIGARKLPRSFGGLERRTSLFSSRAKRWQMRVPQKAYIGSSLPQVVPPRDRIEFVVDLTKVFSKEGLERVGLFVTVRVELATGELIEGVGA